MVLTNFYSYVALSFYAECATDGYDLYVGIKPINSTSGSFISHIL